MLFRLFSCVCVCVCVCIFFYESVCKLKRTHTNPTHTYANSPSLVMSFVRVYVCMCMYIYVCVCMCKLKRTHTLPKLTHTHIYPPAWSCHENGTSSLLYAPHHQLLLSAGKKGAVCIFDIRQRTLRHKFQVGCANIL